MSTFQNSEDLAYLNKITQPLPKITLSKGETLFHKGDSSNDGMYLLKSGTLIVTDIDHKSGKRFVLGHIYPGETVGEMALITREKRSATVEAEEDSILYHLSLTDFIKLQKEDPKIVDAISNIVIHRLYHNQLLQTLRRTFRIEEYSVLSNIINNLERVSLNSGEFLFRQNEIGDALYIVLKGRLKVIVEDKDRKKQVIGEVAVGESVGEMALFTNNPRSASVIAERKSELAKLSKIQFQQLMENYPKSMFSMSQSIINRLQKSMDRKQHVSPVTNITLLRASDKVQMSTFASMLRAALSKISPTIHVTRQMVEEKVHIEDLNSIKEHSPEMHKLNAWLNELESEFCFIIYETENERTVWTDRCIESADRILLIGNSDSKPVKSIPINSEQIETDLALIHPEHIYYPTNTAKWLKTLGHIKHHYHLEMNSKADFERVGRCISGKGIGLVLGGGGARCIAHIGAIRAIEEYGIPIDIIGGTSGGALIGACYSLKWNYGKILRIFEKNRNYRRFCDFTLPIVALYNGRRLKNVLNEIYGEVRIEDSWKEFFCIASNLTQAKQEVIVEGVLKNAIRASISIPGAFPPFIEGDHLLVDGGIFNNLPVEIMRNEYQVEKIICVDVHREIDMQGKYPFKDRISGWRALWNNINPFSRKDKIPNIINILQRTTEVTGIHQLKHELALSDIPIVIPMDQYASFDYIHYQEIFEHGYKTTVEQLEKIN